MHDVADDLPPGQEKIYTNDMSLARGAGFENGTLDENDDWHRTHGGAGGHNVGWAIDVKMPTTDGGPPPPQMTIHSPSYSQERTVELIRRFAEHVPPGCKLLVYFDDPAVEAIFADPNDGIEVQHVGGHDHHLHFQLVVE